jgi:hypothetical protein
MESVVKLTCLTCQQTASKLMKKCSSSPARAVGTEYLVKRSGGMVRLAKAAVMDERARLRKELEELGVSAEVGNGM